MNRRMKAKAALQKVREIDVQLEREINNYFDEVEEGIGEMRGYVEANGFQWNENESVVFNVTTAIGWMGGTIKTLRETVAKLKQKSIFVESDDGGLIEFPLEGPEK